MGALPNLIVIGATKCGTSALHYYLGLHPEIAMSSPKELNFFVDESDAVPGVPRGRRRPNWGRGIEWYRSQFDAGARLRGESAPRYTDGSVRGDRIATRMAEVVPRARLIYLVRDPVERALSHWRMRAAVRLESRSCEQALADPDSVYVRTSRYRTQLDPFLERYGSDRILIVAAEELLERRRQTVARVLGFLGVDPAFWSPGMSRLRNVGERRSPIMRSLERFGDTTVGRRLVRLAPPGAKWGLERLSGLAAPRSAPPTIDPALRRRLERELAEEAAAIQDMAGREFPGWRYDRPQ